MMQQHLTRTFISAILYIAISLVAIGIINPQSIVNFVGPSAALISGLLLIWGITPLIAVLLGTPILVFSISYYFQLEADLAVMSIAVLSIILQGFWTKHLVLRFIHYKKWLTSRKHLFIFLLRIGPIASLVSASSALVISILDNQVIQGSLLYTFVNTWAVSMLVAVFFIPLLLIAKNTDNFALTKRLFVGSTSVLGGLAIFLLLKTSQYQQQNDRQALFQQTKVEVERLIQTEVNSVVHNVNSLSALFKANRYVSLFEFNIFSESIYKEGSSVRALEWAPVIPLEQREAFEKDTSELLQLDFYIKDRLKDGSLASAKKRSKYAPLRFIYPKQGNQEALGLDVYTNPDHIITMNSVVQSQKLTASAPLTLVQGELASPSILFTRAIFDTTSGREFQRSSSTAIVNNYDDLLGFVVAVVQFDSFFQRLANEQKQKVNFHIQDISNNEPFTLFGQVLTTKNRHVDRMVLPVFSRLWQVDIVETEPWFSQFKSWQAWCVLVGGTFGSLLFQMLILMMAAYSSELGTQVNNKTRALILAKESSERKSLAKSHFLQTLNTELRVSLLAMKSFVEQLKKKGINNKEVTGISHAGSNVELLLDTMMDLSNIETGRITAKTDCFDFYGFLQRTESLIKANSVYEGKSTFFLIDESVPHYLNSDELYIQKLLNALIESALQLLKTDKLRLSVKLHKHNNSLKEASLFFTLSSQTSVITHLDSQTLKQDSNSNFNSNSTAFSMAVKYSQLLRGDANLGALSSGDGVLNASIRVTISSSEQQENQQGLTFDLMD